MRVPNQALLILPIPFSPRQTILDRAQAKSFQYWQAERLRCITGAATP
jgi:hypothetical protein